MSRKDALGRDVPEWAISAFDLLAKDGRRVAVVTEAEQDDDDFPGWRCARRRGDVILAERTVHVWASDSPGEPHPEGRWVDARVVTSLADAARRALAMEAERKAPKCNDERCVKSAPGCCYRNPERLDIAATGGAMVWGKVKALQDEAVAACVLPRHVVDPNAGRVSCLRCGADAGFLGISCNRVGGCRLPEPEEPRILGPVFNGPGERPETADVWREPLFSDDYTKTIPEEAWTHCLAERDEDGCFALYATRELAVSAWRLAKGSK